MFSKFQGKKPRSTPFFVTALRMVLINELVQINSGQKKFQDSEVIFFTDCLCYHIYSAQLGTQKDAIVEHLRAASNRELLPLSTIY